MHVIKRCLIAIDELNRSNDDKAFVNKYRENDPSAQDARAFIEQRITPKKIGSQCTGAYEEVFNALENYAVNSYVFANREACLKRCSSALFWHACERCTPDILENVSNFALIRAVFRRNYKTVSDQPLGFQSLVTATCQECELTGRELFVLDNGETYCLQCAVIQVDEEGFLVKLARYPSKTQVVIERLQQLLE